MNDHKALYPVTDDKQNTAQNTGKADQRQRREARLNDALRANLRKRKHQGRERTAADGPEPPDGPGFEGPEPVDTGSEDKG